MDLFNRFAQSAGPVWGAFWLTFGGAGVRLGDIWVVLGSLALLLDIIFAAGTAQRKKESHPGWKGQNFTPFSCGIGSHFQEKTHQIKN